MSAARKPPSRHPSVMTALPLAAALGAFFLLAPFLGISLLVSESAVRSVSGQHVERLADALAPELLAERHANVALKLEAGAERGHVILAPDGRVLSGDPELAEAGNVRSSEIVTAQGQILGTLFIENMQGSGLWARAVMLGFLLAFLTGMAALLGRRVAEGLRDQIGSLSPGRDKKSAALASRYSEISEVAAAQAREHKQVGQAVERLESFASTDPVTGLANPATLRRRIEQDIVRASDQRPAATLLIRTGGADRWLRSLDGDQTDALVKAAGDRLREMTERCEAEGLISGRWMLGRLQDTEFCLQIAGTGGRSDASLVARRLRKAFAEPVSVAGQAVEVTLSGGIALSPEDGTRPQDVLHHARLALLERKDEEEGFRFYNSRLDRMVGARFKLEEEVRAGIAGGEFQAWFQPKICLRTGTINGAEALARWRSADGRLISPGTFIGVAEETGLIREIGNAVLEQACHASAGWVASGLRVPMAVNVSPRQFEDPEFARNVMNTLRQAGLPPRLLSLEITESMAVEDPDSVKSVLKPLSAMGVELAIDDFGTGHSNLATLAAMPFDVFKIDRQYIKTLDTDERAPALIEMMLAMAGALDLSVVAEGIETETQQAFLASRGCETGQGFLYSPAMPADEFHRFAREWNPARVLAACAAGGAANAGSDEDAETDVRLAG